MLLSITELLFGDINAISIPTDALLLFPPLIIFVLLVYLFNNFLETQTNQLIQKIDDNPNLEIVKDKIESQLSLQSSTLEQISIEQPKFKRLSFLSPSRLLGLSGFALLAIGGSNLLSLQTNQKAYEGVNTNQINIMSKNKSTNSLFKIKPLNQAQLKSNKIIYIDSLLSTTPTPKYKNYYTYQVKVKPIKNYFIF
tara:strand:+ start:223 stop:810 length:588 start_codon:yes stop_codon:yes gene_type:complete